MIRWFECWRGDEDGATTIEYSLIAALMAVLVIACLVAFGPSLKSGLVNVGSEMSSRDVTKDPGMATSI